MRFWSRNKLKVIFVGFVTCLCFYIALNQFSDPLRKQFEPVSHVEKVDETIKNERPNQIELEESKENESSKKEDRKEKKRYVMFDGGGGGTTSEIVECPSEPNIQLEVTGSSNRMADADVAFFLSSAPAERFQKRVKKGNKYNKTREDLKEQYIMVYAMESEVHSFGGDTWSRADFKMWYNLELSFPEPATYFDVRYHLINLLSPPIVEYDQKEKEGLVVWVVSNCNAYNGREKIVKSLMNHNLELHSYGGCLKNKHTHPNEHMKGNIELFARYKFVVAIENSNCDGYVSEKLVHAAASGSIPIVAGRDNKPNYLKYMPKNSYINIYDYKSIDEVVAKIKAIGANRTEYESRIHFKGRMYNGVKLTREYLNNMTLSELVKVAKAVLGYDKEREFFDGIVDKEKSENKLCKLGRYLYNTDPEKVREEIEKRRSNRPEASLACLKRFNLANDFKIVDR